MTNCLVRGAAVVLAGAALATSGLAATSPIYINDAPVISPPDVAPQIDATAFVNRSTFSISSGSFLQPLPYETLNTLFFTNTGSGLMFGDPGYRFNFASGNLRAPMDTWVNRGRIRADFDTFFFSTISFSPANWLLVDATNIISTGPMSVGSQGLLRLLGQNIDIRRNGLRSGDVTTNQGFFGGTSIGASNYFNDVGITDIYWGAGTNNTLDDSGNPMVLDGFGLDSLQSDLPFPQSPFHEVIEDFGGFLFTNTVSIPFFSFGGGYDAAVFTNQLGPTNFAIQVVFFPTNSFDTNFTRDVRFFPEFDGGATAVVGFRSIDFDIVSQNFLTNSIFLIDGLAFETNVFLADNFNANTQRPSTYDVTRGEPFFFSFGATNGNAAYDPLLIYNPATYASNQVEVRYTGYSVGVSSLDQTFTGLPSSPLSNPTNFPGRIEIVGDTVNLDQTRVRADSTFVLRAGNITSNALAQVDAPFVVFDVGTVEPLLVVSNIAPEFVRRLNGSIAAWSGIWRNFETNATTTNAIDFHVLIVEDLLQPLQAVVVNEFRVRGSNVVIADAISVGSAMEIDAVGLAIQEPLRLPFGSGWGATNVRSILNFTNRGGLALDGSAVFGGDRTNAYRNFINSGTVSAASQNIRAENFENRGVLRANGGLLSVEALQAKLTGGPTLVFTNVFTNIFFGFTNVVTNIVTNSIGATLAGTGDIELRVEDLVLSNSVIQAGVGGTPGGLVVNATNRAVDAGLSAPNVWEVRGGFRSRVKPPVGNLLGTRINSIAPAFAEALSTWSADDRGAVADGYLDNFALGRLTLDAENAFSLHNFFSNVPDRALYVDFLEFRNFATNLIQALTISPNFTLYFADSNLAAEKLDGAFGGRLRWVPFFAGPHSSTNLTYPGGRIVTLNRALVTSNDRDDDNDGVVNSEDPTPVLVPELTVTVTQDLSPTNTLLLTATLNWDSVAFHTNRVQFKTSLIQVGWQDLTTIVNGPVNMELQAVDRSAATEKFYRVRVDRP